MGGAGLFSLSARCEIVGISVEDSELGADSESMIEESELLAKTANLKALVPDALSCHKAVES